MIRPDPRRARGGRRARRAAGELETDVLKVLWNNTEALSASEVRDRIGDDLAYTTVMTTLGRLDAKGLVQRHALSRGFAYRPLITPAQLAAKQMREALQAGTDHDAILQRFVDGLEPDDEERLRRLLKAADRRRS